MIPLRLFCMVCCAALLPSAAAAQWPADGLPVAPTASLQINPYICTDGDGGVFVVWEDGRVAANEWETSPRHTFGQRVRAVGSAAAGWPATGRPILTQQWSQTLPVVAHDGTDGAFVAAGGEGWHSGAYMSLQHIDGAGNPAGDWPSGGVRTLAGGIVAARPADAQGYGYTAHFPALALHPSGDALLGWSYTPFRNWARPFVGLLDAGTPAFSRSPVEFHSPYHVDEFFSGLVGDGSGGAFAMWIRAGSRDPADDRTFVQHVLPDGTADPRWPTEGIELNAGLGGDGQPGIIGDGLGGCIVAWVDFRGSKPMVYAQRLTPSGLLAAGWPSGGVCVRHEAGNAPITRRAMDIDWKATSLAADGVGGAYVAWTDVSDVTAPRAFLQYIDGQGAIAAGWPAGGIRLGGEWATADPILGAADGGDVFVAWRDMRMQGSARVLALRLTPGSDAAEGWASEGEYVGGRIATQLAPHVVAGPNGTAYVAWKDERAGVPQVLLGRAAPGNPVTATARRNASALAMTPANPVSTGRIAVELSVPKGAPGTVALFDVTGRRLSQRTVPAGSERARFDLTPGERLTPGVYLVNLRHPQGVLHRKIVVID